MIKNIINYLNNPKNTSVVIAIIVLALLFAFNVVNLQITLTFGNNGF